MFEPELVELEVQIIRMANTVVKFEFTISEEPIIIAVIALFEAKQVIPKLSGMQVLKSKVFILA